MCEPFACQGARTRHIQRIRRPGIPNRRNPHICFQGTVLFPLGGLGSQRTYKTKPKFGSVSNKLLDRCSDWCTQSAGDPDTECRSIKSFSHAADISSKFSSEHGGATINLLAGCSQQRSTIVLGVHAALPARRRPGSSAFGHSSRLLLPRLGIARTWKAHSLNEGISRQHCRSNIQRRLLKPIGSCKDPLACYFRAVFGCMQEPEASPTALARRWIQLRIWSRSEDASIVAERALSLK